METPAAITTAEPAPEEVSEFGATVADAQRLLRRATSIYVFFRAGTAVYDTELVDVPKRTLSALLKRREASRPFPCELHRDRSGEYTLTIGGSTAIEKAAGAHK